VSSSERPLVSILVPALNEEPSVPAMLDRMDRFMADNPGHDFELVLVDDGSSDATADATLADARSFAVTVVRLARNFGAHQAISAGLHQCSGDAAIVVGADAQEPDHVITGFLAAWHDGSDVVWGVRRTRTGRARKEEFLSKTFSWLFTRFARLDHYPPEGPSGMLVARPVIDEVNKLDERNRNVMALIAWLGFRQTSLEYDQVPRLHGETRWTRAKMIKLAVDSMLQFSSMPLRACVYAGLVFAVLGLLYAAVLVGRALFGVDTPSGWPTLLVVVVLLGGVQLTVIGIVGEYLWRAVEEVRRRPLFVIRDVRRVPGSREKEQA
jgi:glycosyltransferase involved in cell wall biosynthesis